MTSSVGPQATVPAAVASSPVASTPKPLRIDKRYYAPILVTLVLLVGQIGFGFLESWSRTTLAIVTAIAVEMILSKLVTGNWPQVASSYITGISVGILVRSPDYWPYALCSAISITSKYVLRVRGRHIWNPSNLGIVAMLVLAADTVAPLSIQWGNNLLPMMAVWLFGSIIIHQLGRFHITLTYVASFLALSFVRTLVTGHPWLSEVAPITGPMYQLFIFFMITDPKTTVSSRRGQILVAFLVAVMESVLRLFQFIHAPYYALFTVGPIANLVEIARARKPPHLQPER